MIRLAQKTSLVALAVLACVATASGGEGEWAVWRTPISDNPPRWGSSARHKFPTLEDCDRHAALIFAEFHLMHPTAVLEARCLAETSDWRPAKDQDLWQRDSY
jgi:hypothetical protein